MKKLNHYYYEWYENMLNTLEKLGKEFPDKSLLMRWTDEVESYELQSTPLSFIGYYKVKRKRERVFNEKSLLWMKECLLLSIKSKIYYEKSEAKWGRLQRTYMTKIRKKKK